MSARFLLCIEFQARREFVEEVAEVEGQPLGVEAYLRQAPPHLTHIRTLLPEHGLQQQRTHEWVGEELLKKERPRFLVFDLIVVPLQRTDQGLLCDPQHRTLFFRAPNRADA